MGNKVKKTVSNQLLRTTEAESSSNSLREKPAPLGYPVYTVPGLWRTVHFGATSPTAPVAAAVTIKRREVQQVRETEQILLQLHSFVWPAHVAVCSPATLKTPPPGSPINRPGNNVYLCERKAKVNVYPRIERLLAAVGYKLPKLTIVCCEKLASPSRVRTEFGH